jgi:hypothetical protein
LDREAVSQLDVRQDIGWIRVDSKPVRTQVLYWAEKWLVTYTDFLKDRVVLRMQGMIQFLEDCNATLAQEVVEEGEEANLTSTLES